MKQSLITTIVTFVAGSLAQYPTTNVPCQNGPTTRQCWGQYDINTNYYDVFPTTNKVREYWLSVIEVPCAPDGYQRTCQTFNGTVPGPAITADWGDELVIHVTNNLKNNGTTLHCHGIRQLNNVQYDGVPGVTQCPIAPGQTFTYKIPVTQYGSTWYHSHLSLQYANGLFGPLVLNGPATANYDEDLGAVFLQDWSHTEVFTLWHTARLGSPTGVPFENGLINGMNTYACPASTNYKCLGKGKKWEATLEPGKKYRLRLINIAIEGHFQFSIDGHSLTVIGMDLVPIKPYTTDSVLISVGQRYDVIVEANAKPGNYWLRAGWQVSCLQNGNADGITGIIRYQGSAEVDPTTTSTVQVSTSCNDEPYEKLVPYVPLDVGNVSQITRENLDKVITNHLVWTINSSSLWLDWDHPTLDQVLHGESIFPTEYNAVAVEPKGLGIEWAVLVIQDTSGLGVSHPIHLHGHDFWILKQEVGTYDPATTVFGTINPPRRDVATLPGNGFLAIAFQLNNPGAWLVHCHIAWHASEGLSLEFVESEGKIAGALGAATKALIADTCDHWKASTPVFEQVDSGI